MLYQTVPLQSSVRHSIDYQEVIIGFVSFSQMGCNILSLTIQITFKY